MLNQNKKIALKIGDKIVVNGPVMANYKAKVESIQYDPKTDRTQIVLDWSEHGKSKVYLHDEGSVWFRLTDFN
jgi:hypothetical protein